MLRFTPAISFIFGLLGLFVTVSSVSHNTPFSAWVNSSKPKTHNEIIAKGVSTLQNEKLPFAEKAQIHKILASQYFYIGDFDQVKYHSDQLKTIGASNNDNDILIKAYYLESAYYRSQKNYTHAMQSITQAEKLIKKGTSTYLKNKIYYNAGAAIMENPLGDHSRARKYYQKILSQPNLQSETHQRTRIRLAKIYLASNAVKKANSLLTPLESIELQPRIHTHYLQTLAQIKEKQGYINQSLQAIDEALSIAKTHGQKADIVRLDAYRQEIQSKAPKKPT